MKKLRELLERLGQRAGKAAAPWCVKNTPTFAGLLVAYLDWRDAKRRSRHYALFLRLFKDPKTDMEKIVGGQALHMAKAMVMNYLDSKRVVHCRFCPNTDQMHVWGVGPAAYPVCNGHFEQLSKGATVRKVENPAAAAGMKV